VTDYYRGFAVDYDWLYDDGALTDGSVITRPAVADLLRRAGPGCAVLDAACGTGVDAAALARRGRRCVVLYGFSWRDFEKQAPTSARPRTSMS
jgi:ubiquinone/menaquinone biosynthesis C-methylase UbiE